MREGEKESRNAIEIFMKLIMFSIFSFFLRCESSSYFISVIHLSNHGSQECSAHVSCLQSLAAS